MQKNIFPHINEFNYLNYQSLENRDKQIIKQIFLEIVNRNKIMIDSLKLRKEISKITKKYTLISNENLICDIKLRDNWMNQITLNCEKIKDFFPHAKIILVIRNQIDMIESFYREELTIGTQLSFNEYFEYLKKYYLFDIFKYSKVIQMYFDCFGKNNVKVILFDDLVKKSVLYEFENFLKCSFDESNVKFLKTNNSLSNNSLLLIKFISKFMSKTGILYKDKNSLFYSTVKMIRRNEDTLSKIIKPQRKRFSHNFLHKIKEIYEHDNRKTAKILKKNNIW
ncbi:MAG: hypothetical protein CBB97_13885 [Candidatus Endolissoclinum sp. TMED37]|nr:MAG: hypothetical protein CBB97_13885 [Candidatus Endolissoclinum sp. TMED37]